MTTSFPDIAALKPADRVSKRPAPKQRLGVALGAFTLVEVITSVAIIAGISVALTTAFLQMNTYAALSRLKTCATVIALNQIELVSTDAPFSPPDEQVPVELVLGTQTAPLIVYDDPNANLSVWGVMTTVVEDPGYWQNSMNLNLRKITVTISYTFRNKNYSVTMHTIRASDV